jgi:mannose-1-phosphate guanylyltransferase
MKSVAVIMAGGLGERFWPKSNSKLPKYALNFNQKRTLLGETFSRLAAVYPKDRIYLVGVKEHEALIRKLLPQMKSNRIISEPARCNTAAATALATRLLRNIYDERTVLTFYPADAYIKNTAVFKKTVLNCVRAADKHQQMAVIGIKVTRPSTGFGYVERGRPQQGSRGVYQVKAFHEKPELTTAKRYAKNPQFYWNAGIFTWSIAAYESAMLRKAPEFYQKFKNLNHRTTQDQKSLRSIYAGLPRLPIDKLLIEKMDELLMAPADMGWDDIGTWDALRRLGEDESGNAVLSNHMVHNTKRSVIELNANTRAVISGVRDLIVIQDGDDLLICQRAEADAVKDFRRMWQKRYKTS